VLVLIGLEVATPCILLARFMRRSNESACLVYIANPAEDATTPAMMNIAIVLSFSTGGLAPSFVSFVFKLLDVIVLSRGGFSRGFRLGFLDPLCSLYSCCAFNLNMNQQRDYGI